MLRFSARKLSQGVNMLRFCWQKAEAGGQYAPVFCKSGQNLTSFFPERGQHPPECHEKIRLFFLPWKGVSLFRNI